MGGAGACARVPPARGTSSGRLVRHRERGRCKVPARCKVLALRSQRARATRCQSTGVPIRSRAGGPPAIRWRSFGAGVGPAVQNAGPLQTAGPLAAIPNTIGAAWPAEAERPRCRRVWC